MSWLSLNIFLSDFRLKFNLSYVTSFLPDNLSGLKKNTWIYNLKSCPHITRVPVVFAKKRKISSKPLFWNKRADSRWPWSDFASASVNYVFKFVLNFNLILIIKQIKYY